ncbi:MAG: hypothetical protein CVU09_03010 [Bacteroidetes bacterium HGW-Bacteroidetes-4]|jgi:endonuclease I|nr:MAG: hypothetical protein CVU09_03010 [Bacteroidetes bacterium HGW-Bacteroidetes-4]
MKKLYLIIFLAFLSITIHAQKPGYYNGTENKSGEELKTALHHIIKAHVDFSYNDAKYILNYAEEDPNNTNNLIQFYTNRSVSKESWGTGGNETNREHIWAKSHGNFVDIRPMDGDAHNLHAADASVNVLRSNSDFDEVTGGTYIEEADAYYLGEAFEPADRDKGAVARTIFYMAVRYEGTDGELDLKMVDAINTASTDVAEHGKLSTLLQWNRDFPPTEFERRRNERVFQSQLNRNPFIDNPQFADLIWDNSSLPQVQISNVSMTPTFPKAGEEVEISINLTAAEGSPTAKIYWGKSFNSETNVADFAGTETLTATFSLVGFNENELVYLKTVASTGEVWYNTFVVAPELNLTEITAVQGTGNTSPMVNQTVTVAGIVTANLDNSFYMQTTSGDKYSGICVYSNWRGKIGDSVAVTGKVVEYQNLTEISEVTMVFNYGHKETPVPMELSATAINESYEGMLVKLSDVNFSNADVLIPADGGSYTIMDGTNSITVYVRFNSRLCGTRIPNGTVDVTAVVSQYQTTYQLLIDNIGWIEQGVDVTAPVIAAVNVTDASYIEVSFNEKIKESSVVPSAFSIEGVTIIGAYYYPTTQVYLLVSGIQQKEYTLTVNGVEDLYGNITQNATFAFTSNFSSIKNESSIKTLELFPNPTRGLVTISLDERSNQNSIFRLFDINGRVIHQEHLVEGKYNHQIYLGNNLTKGYYIIQIDNNKTKYTSKIILE